MFNQKAKRIRKLEELLAIDNALQGSLYGKIEVLTNKADYFQRLYDEERERKPKTIAQAYYERHNAVFPVNSPTYEAFTTKMQEISNLELGLMCEQDHSQKFKEW